MQSFLFPVYPFEPSKAFPTYRFKLPGLKYLLCIKMHIEHPCLPVGGHSQFLENDENRNLGAWLFAFGF
jgi:hypothetical protein